MAINNEHGIREAIRKLFFLSNVYDIKKELDERFANVYPEFDPAVHLGLKRKQSGLRKAKYARQQRQQRRQSRSGMREQNTMDGRRRNWTQCLPRRTIWDEDVNHSCRTGNCGQRTQDFNVRAAYGHQNNASYSRGNNGLWLHEPTEQSKRGLNSRSRGGRNPGKRPHISLVAAPGDKVNRS